MREQLHEALMQQWQDHEHHIVDRSAIFELLVSAKNETVASFVRSFVHVLVVLHERVEDEKNAMPRVDIVRGQAGVNLIDELRPLQGKVVLDHRSCSRDQLASECERTRRSQRSRSSRCVPQWIFGANDRIDQNAS